MAMPQFPRECLLAATTELVLELLDAARRVDEALFARVNRMGVHRDVADYLDVLDAVDRFCLPSLDRRTRYELLSSRNVNEYGRVVIGMNALFHGL